MKGCFLNYERNTTNIRNFNSFENISSTECREKRAFREHRLLTSNTILFFLVFFSNIFLSLVTQSIQLSYCVSSFLFFFFFLSSCIAEKNCEIAKIIKKNREINGGEKLGSAFRFCT